MNNKIFIAASFAALMFTACSNNEDMAPETYTYTLKAEIGDISRLSYNESGSAMNCVWGSGDKITIYDNNNVSKGVFGFKTVSGNTGVFEYKSSNQFNTFTGKAVFTRAASASIAQSANNNYAHLANCKEHMEATLTNYDFNSATPATITLNHTQTSVYQIKLKAPAGGITQGATLKMEGTSQTNTATITLNFAMTAGTQYTIYMMGETKGTGSIQFTLTQPSTAGQAAGDTYVWTKSSYAFQPGKYYIVTLSDNPQSSGYGSAHVTDYSLTAPGYTGQSPW